MAKKAVRDATTVLTTIILGFAASFVGCGGNSSSPGGAPTPPTKPASKLFVADSGNHAIGSFTSANPAPGAIPIDRTILGVDPGPIVLDTQRDELYMVDRSRGQVAIFAHASTADGNVVAARRIGSSLSYISISLDTANDVLYAATFESSGTRLSAFNHASSLNATNVTPDRIISELDLPNAIAYDPARNILYSATDGPINAYDNVSAINSASTHPTRIWFPERLTTQGDMSLDSKNNRIYVVTAPNRVSVYNNASILSQGPSGLPIPADRTISISTNDIQRIFIDSVNDRLYIVTMTDVFIINGASAANGRVGVEVTAIDVKGPAGSGLIGIAVNPN